MDFVKEKIRVTTQKLNAFKLIDFKTVEYSFVPCPEYKITNTPPSSEAPWKTACDYQRFAGRDTHFWIHMTIPAIEAKADCEIRLSVKTGREGGWDATNPQVLVYLNGETAQALDTNHTWLPLEFNKEYDVYMYLHTGMSPSDFGFSPSVETVDLLTESLYYDLRVPYDAMGCLDVNSMDYITIREHLDKATDLLDIRDVYSENYYRSINDATSYMRDEFYGKACGNTKGIVGCIGQTHIDVAWLWTVAQTKEKAQRSFSTVINLMKRYDDYKFMSSQPQLYQYVKENDPELYEEIRQRISEGRWEAEGAMWLEPDTNLVSGESLIRHIVYGKRFMKNEFGVDNKILWLPDVFGFSAALPQIMKKTGITQFYTTKMIWNDTNVMPYDNFMWEGIDGSQIFTTFNILEMKLNSQNIKKIWDDYKNKEHTDEAMFTFGFCDGGGGPTYEMMENFRRMQYGIPGMPKTVMKFAGEHIDKVEADFNKKAKEYNTPKWVGEMYLELHRGTYTSMAKNKRNNRKSELLYQQAESIAVTDMLLCGGEYPQDTLEKHQITILTNQFHDILPGSSIKEVYDVTDKEYEEVLTAGRAIADTGISRIKSALKTDGGIFVYNPTPFEISDYVKVNGKTYYAENIPSHGWKVIADKVTNDAVIVTEKSIENDVINVTFNSKYHIVSVYDKEDGREILAKGCEANRLEVFEDCPVDYDAWEINDYYKQKMWIADDVSKVDLLDDGIRIKRVYGKSEIVQDIVLKPHSKRIDFVTKSDWKENHVLLKASFPVDIRNTNATYDIQFGHIERPTHKNTSWDGAKFEVSAHKWADLSEDDYGVSILNDCKYGYSIEDNVMKITLIKCASWPNPDADRCVHEFTYSMYPHNGNFKVGNTIKQGYLLNMPLEATEITATDGTLNDCYSLVYTDKESVVIETIKKAEDDNSVVVRMYDSFNRKTRTTVTTGFDFKEVYVCDMLENNEFKLEHEVRQVQVDVRNFEVVTLKFVR